MRNDLPGSGTDEKWVVRAVRRLSRWYTWCVTTYLVVGRLRSGRWGRRLSRWYTSSVTTYLVEGRLRSGWWGRRLSRWYTSSVTTYLVVGRLRSGWWGLFVDSPGGSAAPCWCSAAEWPPPPAARWPASCSRCACSEWRSAPPVPSSASEVGAAHFHELFGRKELFYLTTHSTHFILFTVKWRRTYGKEPLR